MTLIRAKIVALTQFSVISTDGRIHVCHIDLCVCVFLVFFCKYKAMQCVVVWTEALSLTLEDGHGQMKDKLMRLKTLIKDACILGLSLAMEVQRETQAGMRKKSQIN